MISRKLDDRFAKGKGVPTKKEPVAGFGLSTDDGIKKLISQRKTHNF